MLIFLYGADTFRIFRKLAKIIEEYKRKTRGFGFAVFDAAAGSMEGFFSGLSQNSLFGEKKFFIVKNPISNKEFKESLIDKMSGIALSGHNVVFCQEGKVLKADRLLKALVKYGQVQEFAPLEGACLKAWVAGEFGKFGNPASGQVVEALVSRIGNDLWRLENEIQKLVHFAAGRKITIDDVAGNVALAVDVNIFKTVDAVAVRDKKQALMLTKDHIGKGDHPLYLLTMIAAQFRNLLLVKASRGAGGAGRLGMHPYVFGKTVGQSAKFPFEKITEIYREVCQTDFKIKAGRIDPDAGLDLLLAGI